MSPRCSTICLLLAILIAPRSAAGEAKLRCAAGQCAFVVSGGATGANDLVLQPNAADPLTGRLKLNGFTELFPDWKPPTSRSCLR